MIEDYFFTKNTRWVLWGAFAIIVALLIFHAGVVVGQHQPMRGNMVFIKGVSEPQSGMLSGIMPTRAFVEDGHGAIGTIATISLPTFTMQSRDGLIQKIYAGTTTVVTGPSKSSGQSAYTTSALKSGEIVIVVGDPDDSDDTGYLDARIIHILPSVSTVPVPTN